MVGGRACHVGVNMKIRPENGNDRKLEIVSLFSIQSTYTI